MVRRREIFKLIKIDLKRNLMIEEEKERAKY
jgi:hypothetical protein